MRYSDIKKIINYNKAYLTSIRYEYENDKLYHDYYSSKVNVSLIPKPFAIQKILRVYQSLINIIIPVLVPFWILIIHYGIVFFHFTKYLIQSLSYEKKNISGAIYLDTSDNKYFANINKKESGYPETVVLSPFRRTESNPITGLKEINLLSLTNPLLHIKAAICSSIVIWKMIFSSDKSLIFYSYTSFTWFLVYFTLKNNQICSIWLSNHYDRWTGLISTIPETKLTIIQHGQLYFYDHKTKSKLFPSFSQKIRNVDKVYVINESSKDYFRLYIESKKLKFLKMESSLELTPWRKTSHPAYKILIVGNHVQLPFQLKIIKELYNNYKGKIDIGYKYHPRQTNKVTYKSVWEIHEKNLLPKADIVISYGSSIDYEIEQRTNCEIQYYDYLEEDNLPELLSNIDKRIKLLNNAYKIS